jgi:DNA adenine methylase
MRHITPLRYPGGKARLAPFVKALLLRNNLGDAHYVEPYAGGASVAIALLQGEYITRAYLNDLDHSVYAF